MKTVLFFCFLFHSLFADPLAIYIEHINKNLNGFECRRQEILNLMVQVRVKELEKCDLYQFVNAQDSRFFAYQVIAKCLYEMQACTAVDDFEFLRFPHGGLQQSAAEFFKKFPRLHRKDSDKMFDLEPEISRQVLSGSLSMETNTPRDSAFYVFMHGKGVSHFFNPHEDLFERHIAELFESAGFPQSVYGPYLRQLIGCAPKTNEGIINQIFLPKCTIEKYLYFASTGGPLHSEQNQNIHETIAQFQKERLCCDFDREKNIQARLFVGSLFDGQVKIYRYTLIPEQEQIAYKKLVRETLQKMICEKKQAA